MTTAPKPAPDFVEGADVTQSPEGWDWNTVAEGTAIKVIFDTIGDSFVGQLLGEEHIDQEPNAKGEDQSFDLYLFRGQDGERYSINQSYALVEAMALVKIDQWCRITYIKDVTTQKSKNASGYNAMKDFKVDVRTK